MARYAHRGARMARNHHSRPAVAGGDRRRRCKRPSIHGIAQTRPLAALSAAGWNLTARRLGEGGTTLKLVPKDASFREEEEIPTCNLRRNN